MIGAGVHIYILNDLVGWVIFLIHTSTLYLAKIIIIIIKNKCQSINQSINQSIKNLNFSHSLLRIQIDA